jgi:hypothetical protein
VNLPWHYEKCPGCADGLVDVPVQDPDSTGGRISVTECPTCGGESVLKIPNGWHLQRDPVAQLLTGASTWLLPTTVQPT